MEPATDGKSLENRLKVAALAWACTLTPPTGFEHPEPPSANDERESLEEKVRRHRQEGVFYKQDENEDPTG